MGIRTGWMVTVREWEQRLHLVLAVAVALVAMWVLARPALAAVPAIVAHNKTYTVTGTADGVGSCDVSNKCTTLRAAVIAANSSPGVDRIQLANATYTLSLFQDYKTVSDSQNHGDLDVYEGIQLWGPDGGQTTITVGTGFNDRILSIWTDGGQTVLHRITLAGAVNEVDRSVDWDTHGGALHWDPGSELFAPSAALIIEDSFIQNNETKKGDGGGIAVTNSYNNSTAGVFIRNTTIENNRAPSGAGGGIFVGDGVSVEITDSHITGNTAGAGSVQLSSGTWIAGSGQGGGIYLLGPDRAGASSLISNTQIDGNTAVGTDATTEAAGQGGGIYVSRPLTIKNGSITGNLAHADGGGLFVSLEVSQTLTLEGVAITSNEANVNGGGLMVAQIGTGGKISMTGGAVTGNCADSNGSTLPSGSGGGIYKRFVEGTLTFPTNPTITGNRVKNCTTGAIDDLVAQEFDFKSTIAPTGGETAKFRHGQHGATYKITLTNVASGWTGFKDGGPMTVTLDPMPTGLTLVDLTGGTGWTCDKANRTCTLPAGSFGIGAELIATVDVAQNAPGTANPAAGVSGGGELPWPAVRLDNNRDVHTTTLLPAPDVTLEAVEQTLKQNETNATFKLRVKNIGDAPTVGDITVNANIPGDFTLLADTTADGWTCTTGTPVGAVTPVTCTRTSALAANGSSDIDLLVDVARNAQPSPAYTTTVSGGDDVWTGDNGLSATVTVTPRPDLTVAISHDGDFLQGQTDAAYTVSVGNPGNAAATEGIRVTAALPAGMTVASMSGIGWSCYTAASPLSCTHAGSLPVDATWSIDLVVKVARDAAAATEQVVNVAALGSLGELDTTNNSATDSTTVVQLVAPGSGTVAVSPTSVTALESDVTLTFTYTAAGTMRGGVLSLTIPAQWTAPQTAEGAGKVTASAGGPLLVAGNTVTLPGLDLAEDGTVTITYGGATAQTTGGVDAPFVVKQGSSVYDTPLTALVAGSPAVTVNKVETAVAVTSSRTPAAAYGQSATYTATVTASGVGVVPAGRVLFRDGATELGWANLDGEGKTAFTTDPLAVGTHSITAVYEGDDTFLSSTSAALTQQVDKAGTTAVVTTSGSPTLLGASVTFAVTFTSATGFGTPGGTVRFTEGADLLHETTLSSGTASWATSALSAGEHTINVEYVGDDNFTGSTGNVIQKVKAVPTLTLQSSLNPAAHGESVTFTLTTDGGAFGVPTGTVSFKDNGVLLDNGSLTAGTVSVATATLSIGSHDITAEYAGDTIFAPASATAVTQEITRAVSVVNLASSLDPSTYGQSATYTANVSAQVVSLGTPTGTVTFKDGTTTLAADVPLVDGVASHTDPRPGAGSHSITVTYHGNATFATGSDTLTQQVDKAGTSVAVTTSSSPALPGESVTFGVEVSPTSGIGTPTGTIRFKEGTDVLHETTLSGGAASWATDALAAGEHTITVEYDGDGNFTGSTGSVSQRVKAVPTLTLETSLNPAAYGESVTFTLTADGGAFGVPTGTVSFKDNGVLLDSGSLTAGAVSVATETLSIGSHTITAEYAGDTIFAPASATAVTQEITRAVSVVDLASGLNPSTYGQSVTYTATVSAQVVSLGTPTGTVTFKDGEGTLEADVALVGGAANFTDTRPVAGSHSITVTYHGNATFATGSDTLTQQVDKAGTSVAVTTSSSPALPGESVTFGVEVSPTSGIGTPTGTIRFKEGTDLLHETTLSGGAASWATSALTSGDHTITVEYDGDGNFTGSTGSVSQRVKATPTLTLQPSLNPAAYGESVTFTVTAAGGAFGVPTGTVTFKDNGVLLDSGSLTEGTVSVATATLSIGSHDITAEYVGDTIFAPASATAVTQEITRAVSVVDLASSLNPSLYGQSVTYTATVSAQVLSLGTPTGTVTFKDGTTTLAADVPLVDGVASHTASRPALDGHMVTATYNGNATFATGSDTLTQQVNADTAEPTWPVGASLTVSAVHETDLILTWTGGQDNVSVASYRIYRDGTEIGNPTAATFLVTGVTKNRAYTFTVKAEDPAGNLSAALSAAATTALGEPELTIQPANAWLKAGSSITVSFTGQPGVTASYSLAFEESADGSTYWPGTPLTGTLTADAQNPPVYSAVITVPDGSTGWRNLDLTVTATDGTGATTQATLQTGNRVDRTPPTLNASHNATQPLKAGEQFTVTVESEPGLTGQATLTKVDPATGLPRPETALSHALTETAAGSGRYTCTHTVVPNDEGEVQVSVSFSDLAGNQSDEVISPAVIFDNTRIIGMDHDALSARPIGAVMRITAWADPDLTVHYQFDLAGGDTRTGPLTEVAAGIYEAEYLVAETDITPVGGATVSLTFITPFSMQTKSIARPLIFDTGRPVVGAVTVTPDRLLAAGDELVLSASGDAGLRMVATVEGLFRSLAMAESPSGTYSLRYTVPAGRHVADVPVQLSAWDPSGNLTGAISGARVTVVSAPPKVTVFISDQPCGQDGWYSEAPTLTIIVDAGATLTFKDGLALVSLDPPVIGGGLDVYVYTVPDGGHAYSYSAVMNGSEPASGTLPTIKVDTAPPAAPALSADLPAGSTVTRLPTVNLTVTPGAGDGVTELDLLVTDSLSQALRLLRVVPVVSGGPVVISDVELTEGADGGVSRFTTVARDAAGNTSPFSSQLTVTRDSTAPTFQIAVDQTTRSIEVTPSETLRATPALTVQAKADGTALTVQPANPPISGATHRYTWNGSANGTALQVLVNGVDLAGNAGSGHWVEARLNPAQGGTIKTDDDQITADFDPGDLDGSDVSIESVPTSQFSTHVPPGTQILGAYDFRATLSTGATVEVSYTLEITGTTPPGQSGGIGFYYMPVGQPNATPTYVPAQVTVLGSRAVTDDAGETVNLYTVRLQATLPHFSVWAPFADMTAPEFQTAILVDGVPAMGQRVRTTTVTVTGTVDGTAQTAEASVNSGATVATQNLGALTAADKSFSLSVPLGAANETKIITMKVTDEFGNYRTQDLTLVLDTVPPAIANLKVAGSAYTSGTTLYTSAINVRLSGESIDPAALLTVSGTGVDHVLGSFDTVTDLMANTENLFTVTAADAAGNQSTALFRIQHDWVAPSVTITGLSPISPDHSMTLSYSVDEPVSSVVLAIDGGATVDGAGSQTYPDQSHSGIALLFPPGDGAYTLTATVTDRAGNVAVSTQSMEINSTAPSVTLTATPNPTNGAVTLSVTATSGGAPLADTPVSIRVRGELIALTNPNTDALGQFTHSLPLSALTEGANTVSASLVGPSHLTGSASVIVTRDTTPPEATGIAVSPTATKARTTVSFTLSEAASVLIGSSGGGGETDFGPQPAGPFSGEVSFPADGVYDLTATLTDSVANSREVGLGSATRDATPPAITLQDLDGSATGDITFGYQATDNLQVSRVTLTVDHGATLGVTTSTESDLDGISLHFPADGTYSVTATAEDATGNTATISQLITVDSAVPVVTVIVTPTLLDQGAATLTAVATANGLPAEDAWDLTLKRGGQVVANGHTTGGSYTYTLAAAELAEGANVLKVSITKPNGLRGSGSALVTKDTTDPNATALSVAPTHITSGSTTLGFTLSEASTVLLEYQRDDGAWTAAYSSGNSYLPAGSQTRVVSLPGPGEYRFRITVTDALGHTRTVGFLDEATWDHPADPVIMPLQVSASANLTRGSTVVLTGSTAPWATVSIEAAGQGIGSLTAGDDGSFKFTAALVEGENHFVVTASSLGRHASATLTVVRDTQAPALAVAVERAEPAAESARLVITTEPGAQVTVNQQPVSVGADGVAALSVTLPAGRTEFVVAAADLAGNIRITTVVLTRSTGSTDPGTGPDDATACGALTDMAGHWAEAPVCGLVQRGVVQGFPDGSFRPEATVTRSQFMVMLARSLGIAPQDEATLTFSDQESIPNWARGHVAALVQAGIARGDAEGSFRPDAEISRAELAVLATRVLAYKGIPAESGPIDFSDQESIPGWALEAVRTAVASDLLTGFPDGSFGSGMPATRAQAAVLINRLAAYGGVR